MLRLLKDRENLCGLKPWMNPLYPISLLALYGFRMVLFTTNIKLFYEHYNLSGFP